MKKIIAAVLCVGVLCVALMVGLSSAHAMCMLLASVFVSLLTLRRDPAGSVKQEKES